MPIVLKITVANGNTPSYHKISSISTSERGTELMINSWMSQEVFESGMPLCWQDIYQGPPVSSIEEAEALLVATGGAFEGGVILGTVSDVQLEKSKKKADLESEMARRVFLPITVDMITVDGDKTAQDNLKSKLEEVRARIELAIGMPVELLVWRDAANETHAWEDITSYHQWLCNFAIALSTRGTVLYKKCWMHKSSIDALTTSDEVRSYDIYSDVAWA